MTKPSRQSTRTFVALAFCIALQMSGFAMVVPLFARRFESYGAGVQALGVSDMAFALTSIIAAPLTGMLADRFGRRPVILLSLAGNVLAFGGYLFAATTWQLILLRGLAGVFTAGLVPAMISSVGDLAPENRRARWIGVIMGSASAGYIIGPLLGGLLYDRSGYAVPFAVSLAAEVGALLPAVFWIPETFTPAVQPGPPRQSWLSGWQALPARSTFLLLLFITFGVMFAWTFIGPQFMFYAYDDLRWTSAQMGLVWSAYAGAFMIGEFALGQLSDRLGRKPVLVLGLAVFLAPFAGLVVFRDLTWIAVGFTLGGLGNALYDPALSAMILDTTPPEHTASMLGIKSMASSLGSLLGPALVVLFTTSMSPQGVFLIATGVVFLLALTSGVVLRPAVGGQNFEQTAAAR